MRNGPNQPRTEGNLTRTTRRAAFLLWCPRLHASYRTGHRPAQGGGRAAPAPAPCGHHHGRKWPLGGAAGAAPAGRSSPRKRFRGGGDARRAPHRPAPVRRQGDRSPPLDGGAAAARAGRAHQRGVPCLELPPLAAGVCGDPFHRDALAGFRRARSAARHRGFPEARAALREDERADPHRMSEKNRNLVIRVTTAVVLLPGVLWLIWRGGFPLALLIGAAAAACAFELNQLPRTELSGAAIVSTAAALLIPLLQEASPGWVTTDLVLSAVLVLPV